MTRAVVFAALVASLLPPGAAATPGSLPSPAAPVRSEPPLRTQTNPFSATERRFPRRLASTIDVRVGVDRTGRAAHVTARDRIVVLGTGDYSFAIPAPATRVVAGPGSASQPGLRSGTVLWQGFSAGRRALVADISLDPGAAAKALPVRLTIAPGELRIENATAASVSFTTGPASGRAVAAAFRSVYGAVRSRTPIAAPTINFTGSTRIVRQVVRARLHVAGSYRFATGPSRTLSRSLANEPLRLTGDGELRLLDLRVTAEPPIAPLRARATHVEEAALRIYQSALAAQYESYLANPDPSGETATSYRFTLAPKSAEATRGGRGSSGRWLAVGLAAAAVLALGGGLVLWAHS